MKILKVFISYSSLDGRIAGLFKKCFEEYAGFSIFLAHEDIAPALEWELKIIKNLREANIIIPLITNNYRNSEFTDQELGMSLAWNKIIIPIKLSTINPYGFIKKIQALKCEGNENKIIDAVTFIAFVLTENSEFNKFKEAVIDSVIEAFNKSGSFKTTRIIIRVLAKIKSFNKDQIIGLKRAIKNNNQVYDEVYALPDFKKILTDKHKIVIDS
jgi:hypothetical protein